MDSKDSVVTINLKKWKMVRTKFTGSYNGEIWCEEEYVNKYLSMLQELGITPVSIPGVTVSNTHTFKIIDQQKFIIARLKYSL